MAFDQFNNIAVFDGNGQTLSGRQKISKASWVSPDDAADTLVLTDAEGNDLGTYTAGQTGGEIAVRHLEGVWVKDLTVTTIGSGKFYVHYE